MSKKIQGTYILVQDIDNGRVVGLLAGVHKRRAALRQGGVHVTLFGGLLALDLGAFVEEVAGLLGLFEDGWDGLAPAADAALFHNKRGLVRAMCRGEEACTARVATSGRGGRDAPTEY